MLLSTAIHQCLRSLSAGGDSPNTVSLYNWGMDHLQDYLGDIEIHEITKENLEDFMGEMSDEYIPQRQGDDKSPLSSSSMRNLHIAIHRLFTWAAENWKVTGVTSGPDLDLEMPIAVHRKINPLTPEEIKKLIEQALFEKNEQTAHLSRKRGAVLHLIALTLVGTGIRVSELCRLNVKDFSKLTKTITIHAYGNSRRKTKYRQIDLPNDAFVALQDYLATRPGCKPSDPLFINEDGKRWTRSAVRHALTALSMRAGISKVHPHVLRHTFSVEFIRNHRGTYTQLRYLLGEATFAMVDHYIKLTNEEVLTCHSLSSTVDRYNLSAWVG